MKAQAKTRANHFVTGMLMKSKKSLSTSGPELRERERETSEANAQNVCVVVEW